MWRGVEAVNRADLVLTLQTVTRGDPDSGEVELRAWPAAVFREGYQDRRKAFSDLGIDPE